MSKHILRRDYVVCQICKKKLRRISSTHLAMHNITMKEYKLSFPNSSIDCKYLKELRGKKLKNKTYEEIHGNEEGIRLKKRRSDSASNQMKKSEQIKVRRLAQIGKPKSKESIEKMKKSKSKPWGKSYRENAFSFYGKKCQRCGETDVKKLVVHHIDMNSSRTELGNHSLENLLVLCKKCHSKLHNELQRVHGGFVGLSQVERGMHLILKGLKLDYGLDLSSEHFKETPKRVARAYAEIFEGVKNTNEQVNEILGTSFTSDTDEMIVLKDIECFSMCPHHFLPVEYKISLGYIPNGQILGISKLARLVELLAKRPVVQEELTRDITNQLQKINPKGVAVHISGRHFCMIMRGVKKPDAVTITSSVEGVFRDKQIVRDEFFMLLKNR